MQAPSHDNTRLNEANLPKNADHTSTATDAGNLVIASDGSGIR